MGLFRPSREHQGADPYYHWKAILFSVGAAFGLGAMVTDRDWLILVAVPVLAVGVGLRWLPGGTGRHPAEADDEEFADEEDADQSEGRADASGGKPPELPPPT